MIDFDALRNLEVNQNVSKNDRMYNETSRDHYFYVGRSNLWTVINILNIRKSYPAGDTEIKNIFDFGCGHGRITRYMRAVFPSSVISIADYDKSGVQFCVDNFNCVDGNGSIPQNTFDLVFLSSVFTHLPAKIVEPLLERLLQSLNHNGVLIFTTQGRYSIERIKGFDWANEKGREWMHYNLGKDTFAEVAHLYEETGYGYVNYPNQTDYGVCIAKPSWYSNIALRRDDVIQILFQEKGSDNHQDVSAFMRANLTDHSKGPLW